MVRRAAAALAHRAGQALCSRHFPQRTRLLLPAAYFPVIPISQTRKPGHRKSVHSPNLQPRVSPPASAPQPDPPSAGSPHCHAPFQHQGSHTPSPSSADAVLWPLPGELLGPEGRGCALPWAQHRAARCQGLAKGCEREGLAHPGVPRFKAARCGTWQEWPSCSWFWGLIQLSALGQCCRRRADLVSARIPPRPQGLGSAPALGVCAAAQWASGAEGAESGAVCTWHGP